MNFDMLFNVLTALSIVALTLAILAQFVVEKGRTEHG